MGQRDSARTLARFAFIATSILVIITAAFWGARLFVMYHNHTAIQTVHTTQPADSGIAGFPIANHPAPDFHLINQFSQPVSLSSLRGHEVVLAFVDSRCTTICPLTAEIMYNARAHLSSSAASQVELVAVNANPTATSVPTIQAWSINHGMLHQWTFLTGTAQQLLEVYHAYGIYDQVSKDGEATHDPAIYIIDAQGREHLYFETINSNTTSDLKDEEAGLEAGMRQWLPQPA